MDTNHQIVKIFINIYVMLIVMSTITMSTTMTTTMTTKKILFMKKKYVFIHKTKILLFLKQIYCNFLIFFVLLLLSTHLESFCGPPYCQSDSHTPMLVPVPGMGIHLLYCVIHGHCKQYVRGEQEQRRKRVHGIQRMYKKKLKSL